MRNLARVRGFLLLRQSDVERATGVPRARLAQAESGRIALNPAEERALDAYYQARLRMVLEDEGECFEHKGATLELAQKLHL
jgi:hypothetical protein